MSIPFLKMHGLGNDFVVIDDLGKPQALLQPVNPELAIRICDRRFGVGCDQLLWLRTPQGTGADARMEIWNGDGSVAEMCGNGIRAVALYLYRHGPQAHRPEYVIETLAGPIRVWVGEDGVRVDMGGPVLGAGFADGLGEKLLALGREFRFFEVGMGNPHAVIFLDAAEGRALDRFPLEKFGPAIEILHRFPKRTNVEFVHLLGGGEIQVRVWERGAGATLACGTGACAAAVATLATRRAEGELAVHLPGGTLRIGWEGVGKPVLMEGPAAEVFRGEFYV